MYEIGVKEKINALVAVAIVSDGKVLLGKHANGAYEGLYGLASSPAALERRPQKTAAKLAEWSSLGLLGLRSELEFRCKAQGRSALGIRVYAIETEKTDLPSMIRGTQAYISSCFPYNAVGQHAVPEGLLAWRDCKFYTATDALSHLRLDPASRDTVQYLQTKLLRTNAL